MATTGSTIVPPDSEQFKPSVIKLATRAWNHPNIRRCLLKRMLGGDYDQTWYTIVTLDKTTCADVIYWRYRYIRYTHFPWKYIDAMPEERQKWYKSAVVGISLLEKFPYLVRKDIAGFQDLLSYFPNLVDIRAAQYHLRRVNMTGPQFLVDIYADDFKMGPNGITSSIMPPEDFGLPGTVKWRYHLRVKDPSPVINAYLEHWIVSHTFHVPKCFDLQVTSLVIEKGYSPEPWIAILRRRTACNLPPILKITFPAISKLSDLSALGEAAGKGLKNLYLMITLKRPHDTESVFDFDWKAAFPDLVDLRIDLRVPKHPQLREWPYSWEPFSSAGTTLTPPLYGVPERYICDFSNQPIGVKRFKLLLFVDNPVEQPIPTEIDPCDLQAVQKAVDDIVYALPDPRLIANAISVETEFNFRLLCQRGAFVGVAVSAVYINMLRRYLANNVYYSLEEEEEEEEENEEEYDPHAGFGPDAARVEMFWNHR